MSSASGARSARRSPIASLERDVGVVVGCQRDAASSCDRVVSIVSAIDSIDAEAVVDPVERVRQRRRQLGGRPGDRGRRVDAVTDREDRRTERGERVVDGLDDVLGDDQRRVDGRQRLLGQHEALLVGVGQLAEELPSDDGSDERADDADVGDDDHDLPGRSSVRPRWRGSSLRIIVAIVAHVVASGLGALHVLTSIGARSGGATDPGWPARSRRAQAPSEGEHGDRTVDDHQGRQSHDVLGARRLTRAASRSGTTGCRR